MSNKTRRMVARIIAYIIAGAGVGAFFGPWGIFIGAISFTLIMLYIESL